MHFGNCLQMILQLSLETKWLLSTASAALPSIAQRQALSLSTFEPAAVGEITIAALHNAS